MLVFPAIVIAGCLDQLPPWLRPLARSLGALSYPVYVLQWPTICRTGYRLFYGRHGIDFAVGYALDIAAILTIAWFALKLYDAPVRHFLTATFILKGKTKPGVSAMPLAGDEQPF
jgi:peptidoglycan/LPS O-acetylase OafA/YrhL